MAIGRQQALNIMSPAKLAAVETEVAVAHPAVLIPSYIVHALSTLLVLCGADKQALIPSSIVCAGEPVSKQSAGEQLSQGKNNETRHFHAFR